MMYRLMIEFAVDVPNEGVAGDVATRLHEHGLRLVETLAQMTGHAPLQAPDRPGFVVGGPELVHWDPKEQDWLGEDDDEDDDDDDDDKDD